MTEVLPRFFRFLFRKFKMNAYICNAKLHTSIVEVII